MKFIQHFALVILCFTQYHIVHAQLLWQYTDSLDQVRRGDYIFATASGMYVFTDEYTGSYSATTGRTHVLYLNRAGELQWQRKINIGNPDFTYGFFSKPVLTSSGNLVYRKVKAWSDTDVIPVLEKFTPNGSRTEVEEAYGGILVPDNQGNIYSLKKRWDGYLLKRFNESLESTDLWTSETYAGQVYPLTNGEFYQYGDLYKPPFDPPYFGVRKLTSDGTLIWETYYPSPYPSQLQSSSLLTSAIDPNDNVYQIVQFNYHNELSDYVIFKISASGDLVWQRNLITNSNSGSEQIKLVVDASGNCYTIGAVANNNNNYGDGYTNKFSPVGNLLWSRRMTYNGINPAGSYFNNVVLEGDYIFAVGYYGWRYWQDTEWKSAVDLLAMKINKETGNVEWKATYLNSPENNSANYAGLALAVKNDSVFITGIKNTTASELLVACFAASTNVNGNLVGLAPYLTVDTENPLALAVENFNVFPNPAIDKIFLNRIDSETTGRLSIFNSHGQQVLAKENVGSNQEINVANLPAGFYSLQWQTNSGIGWSKMIKQ